MSDTLTFLAAHGIEGLLSFVIIILLGTITHLLRSASRERTRTAASLAQERAETAKAISAEMAAQRETNKMLVEKLTNAVSKSDTPGD